MAFCRSSQKRHVKHHPLYRRCPAGPSAVNTVGFWVYPASTTDYFIDLNGSAYIWVNAATVTATGFTSPTIYVNGVVSYTLFANAWQYVAVTTATSLNASDLDIGRLEDTDYFAGKIDDLRIYNYTRTQKQILSCFLSSR